MVKYVPTPIENVYPGMIVGAPVENRMGRHLVEQGATLHPYEIDMLKKLGIQQLTIQYGKETASDINRESILSPTAARAVARLRREDPSKVHLETNVKKRISTGIQLLYQDPDPRQLAETTQSIASDLLDAIEHNNAVALNINDLKMSDEYTYEHSVDVATIAMIIAKQQGRPRKEIYEIGMAGLLHDIGKTKVPPEILNKPGRLTDEEFSVMKKHSLFSYMMVEHNADINADVAQGMLQHHEKMDGSGYPSGAPKDKIHPYAKILTVADIYDALVTDRPYKKGITSKEAVEMLMAMTGQISMSALQTFLSSMILYPVDSTVLLSNGEYARVVQKNPNFLLRPIVVGVKSGKVYDLGSLHCQNIVIES